MEKFPLAVVVVPAAEANVTAACSVLEQEEIVRRAPIARPREKRITFDH